VPRQKSGRPIIFMIIDDPTMEAFGELRSAMLAARAAGCRACGA
jgi:hypothetical protein